MAVAPMTGPASGDPVPERGLVSRPTGHAGRVRGDQAVPAVFDWQQAGDSRAWVSPVPGRPGDPLVVTELGRGRYQPVVEGPARLRGPLCQTLSEAKTWCQRRVEK